MISETHKADILYLSVKLHGIIFVVSSWGKYLLFFFILCYTICSDWVLSLELECGNFILTDSIAFFYTFGLTSIVTPTTCILFFLPCR